MSTLNELTRIFERHKTDRVCVIGTTCCGKTTLLRTIPNCVDMDNVLFSQLTTEELKFLNQKPWTSEIGREFDMLTYKKVQIQQGQPMFGTVILDCDVVVFLDISDELLEERCEKRGVSFSDAKNMEKAIRDDWESHKITGIKQFYSITIE